MFPSLPLLHLRRPPSQSSFQRLFSILPPSGRLHHHHRIDPRAQPLPRHLEATRSPRLAQSHPQLTPSISSRDALL
ncbi:hypothetical protein RHMOL_Rhmol04G0278200 [Rhododendron molle]|uniref:Uncharacterized protein n=1 Tax=Rhododendron molle TaxID=49168 RepID=A0ACC0P6B8_RHOML|nr:hypothetical protein RHMOL_Rhmol04G0278200 [Rhododendron molle]